MTSVIGNLEQEIDGLRAGDGQFVEQLEERGTELFQQILSFPLAGLLARPGGKSSLRGCQRVLQAGDADRDAGMKKTTNASLTQKAMQALSDAVAKDVMAVMAGRDLTPLSAAP